MQVLTDDYGASLVKKDYLPHHRTSRSGGDFCKIFDLSKRLTNTCQSQQLSEIAGGLECGETAGDTFQNTLRVCTLLVCG